MSFYDLNDYDLKDFDHILKLIVKNQSLISSKFNITNQFKAKKNNYIQRIYNMFLVNSSVNESILLLL